ncbi:uncharacterized protein BO97DRAFT_420891 [Aspergillus homomorphus CBS 101889]|uniref:Uncharacterized protein n=1 Tax=Aspergillus homomorphus (strain CBS 101889) TaxID=1450537 RepID=A0A395I9W8_ASPHC|nr:hypothetical protein BO97DRAFT_420891 [Aspergillus homomorphus CBS 101889]RAL16589.1 hypothetical protein BO97DRAFT_420891 [Aspergillus homomorphus CBS 101889]
MTRATRYARRKLDGLYTKLVTYRESVVEGGHVDLSQHVDDIVHQTQFNFKEPLAVLQTTNPPFLFRPMSQELLEMNPTEASLQFQFFDYTPGNVETMTSRNTARTQQTCNLIHTQARDFRLQARGMSYLTYPDLFFLDDRGFDQYYPPDPILQKGCAYHFFETVSDNTVLYPHITIIRGEPKNGQEDKILYGELATLITAMRNRANQRKVQSSEERNALLSADKDPAEFPFLFPDEEHFPVLLISCVGPQHARIFYACMDERKLHIRQSRLFSFEQRSTAPVSFFGSMLLNRAVMQVSEDELAEDDEVEKGSPQTTTPP